MEFTTFRRNGGYVSVAIFLNGRSIATSTKVYATKKGAEKANDRVNQICGPTFGRDNIAGQDFPYTRTDIKTGIVSRLYVVENVTNM